MVIGLPISPVRVQLSGLSTDYAAKVARYAPVAHWPLWEAAGPTVEDQSGNDHEGAASAGITFGEDGIGDGETSILVDGSGEYVDVYSAGLNVAFPRSVGALFLWANAYNAGVWSGGGWYLLRYYMDNSNFIWIAQTANEGELQAYYRGQGSGKSQLIATGSPQDWFNVGLAWNAVADEIKFYFAGEQVGSIQTGVLALSGNLLSSQTVLGAGTYIGNADWYGWLKHAQIYDWMLDDAAMADLATV
jgi:hypothetical protein